MSTSEAQTTHAGRRIAVLAAGLIAAGLGTTLVAVIAKAAGADQDFPALQPGAYLFFTVIGFLAGLAGWSLIRAKAKNPAATLRRLVPTVVAASLIPNVLLLFADSSPGPGAVIALMLMHLVVAVFAVPAYARALPV